MASVAPARRPHRTPFPFRCFLTNAKIASFLDLLQFQPSLSSRNSRSEAIANKFIVLLSWSVRIWPQITCPSCCCSLLERRSSDGQFPLARNLVHWPENKKPAASFLVTELGDLIA